MFRTTATVVIHKSSWILELVVLIRSLSCATGHPESCLQAQGVIHAGWSP